MKDFIDEFNGKTLDYDGVYGGQCVDVAKKWLSILGYEVSGSWGNAINWDKRANSELIWIPNAPTGVPQEGDLIVWGMPPYGHIAVFVEGDTNRFTSFDQNYPVGSVCHIQEHNYNNVKGWLHPTRYATQGDKMIPHSSIEGRIYDADGKLLYWIDTPETIQKYFEGGTGPSKPISELIPPQIKEVEKPVDRPETLQELEDVRERLVEANKTISDKDTEIARLDEAKNKAMEAQAACLKSKGELFNELDSVFDKNIVIPKDFIKKIINKLTNLINKKKI